MRFDSLEHLVAFNKSRVYPKIHDDLFHLVVAHSDPTQPFVDLCCSTGLLGQRLLDENYQGFGVDTVLHYAAVEAGVALPLFKLKITRSTLPSLGALLHEHHTQMVVARRCLPELLGTDNFGAELGKLFIDAGVTDVFLQGRKPTKNPRNPLHCLAAEVQALKPWWKQAWLAPGDCAHLVRA